MFEGRIANTALSVTAHSSIDLASDPIANSLRHLSHLFSVVDRDLVPCWNQQCNPGTCTRLTREVAFEVLRRLGGTAGDVFGMGSFEGLSEAQQADLLVTWQWIKSRTWGLASLHSLLDEQISELSSGYPTNIALATVALCNQLSFGAMECHGTGFVRLIYLLPVRTIDSFQVEKVYDIAELPTLALTSLAESNETPVALDVFEVGLAAAQQLQSFIARHHRGGGELATKLQGVITEAWLKRLPQ